MSRKPETSYNAYFFVPFVLWAIAGVVLHFLYGKVALFRFINVRYSDFLNEFMSCVTWLGTAQLIIPLLLVPMLSARYRNWWYFSLALACNVAPFLVLQVLKSFFNMYRPMHYFEGNSWIHILEPWERIFERSFPSGHSEGAFSLFCFLSLLLPSRYRVVGFLFFVLAFLVGYSRVYLTAHFVEDVWAGSIVGVVVTTVVYIVMNRRFRQYFDRGAAQSS